VAASRAGCRLLSRLVKVQSWLPGVPFIGMKSWLEAQDRPPLGLRASNIGRRSAPVVGRKHAMTAGLPPHPNQVHPGSDSGDDAKHYRERWLVVVPSLAGMLTT